MKFESPFGWLAGACIAAGLWSAAAFSETAAADEKGGEAAVLGVFVGTSPFDESIRLFLGIPEGAEAHIVQWKLTLYQESGKLAPAGYKLHARYGLTAPNRLGLGGDAKTWQRGGRWSIRKGTKGDPGAVVYELEGAVAFCKVDENLLHVLNRDRSLMVGTSGWSFTLNRLEVAEKPAPPATRDLPDRTVSPLATGPVVFGVFEGRSPSVGIARELKIDADVDMKAKWRITLYQNPETRTATTYKVESSLHRSGAREGRWAIVRGTDTDPQRIVYRLEPTETEAALFLLKGDDNVLFFLDQNQKPLIGHADFSYTLNRRKDSPTELGR